MFDISELQQDTTITKEIPIDCLKRKQGEKEAVLVIQINDEIRKKEQQLTKRYLNRMLYQARERKNIALEPQTDQLAYCQGIADYCVIDSRNLFSEKGKPIKHSKDGFKILLMRYPLFLRWFANTLTRAFEDYDLFVEEEEEDIRQD